MTNLRTLEDVSTVFGLFLEAVKREISEKFCVTCPSSIEGKPCERLNREATYFAFKAAISGALTWAKVSNLDASEWWPAIFCAVCEASRSPMIRIAVKDCMKPVINEGDLVLVTRRVGDVRVGDIVVLKESPGGCRVRRVVEVLEGGKFVRTIGDYRKDKDERPIKSERVCGKVVEVIKRESGLWKKLV